MSNLVPVIEQVKAVMADAKAKIADKGGWDLGDFKDVYNAFVGTVVAVEAAAQELGGLTEAEKKDAVAETLNWMVDLPWMTEGMEAMAFELLVGLVWEFGKSKLAQ